MVSEASTAIKRPSIWKSKVPATKVTWSSNNDDDAETLLVGVIVAAHTLALRFIGWKREALALFVAYAMCAMLGRRFLGIDAQAARAPRRIPRCHLRDAASDSLALGCCTPALVIASLAILRLRAGSDVGPLRAYVWATLSCAVQPTLSTWCDGCPLPSGLRAHVDGVILGVIVAMVTCGGVATASVVGVMLLVHAMVFHAALRHTHGSFTVGEAATVAQGLAVLVVDAAIASGCKERISAAPIRSALQEATWCIERPPIALGAQAVLCGGLLLAFGLALLLACVDRRLTSFWRAAIFVGAIAVSLRIVLLPWLDALVGEDGLLWLVQQISLPVSLQLVAYWLLALTVGIAAATQLTSSLPTPRSPDSSSMATQGRFASKGNTESCEGPVVTRAHRARLLLARKVYHLLVVALFAPGVLYALPFLRLALGTALPLLLLLEVIRCHDLPPFADPWARLCRRFLDARDQGTLILTHIYLLLGCALPIFMPIPQPSGTSWRASVLLAAVPHAGLAVLGAGDAAASVVGVYFGRRHWPRSHKTFEGTAAAVLAVLALLAALLAAGSTDSWSSLSGVEPVLSGLIQIAALILCVVIACVLEAITTQIDNLFLPLIFQILLCTSAAALL